MTLLAVVLTSSVIIGAVYMSIALMLWNDEKREGYRGWFSTWLKKHWRGRK